jgi:hypothetical protein
MASSEHDSSFFNSMILSAAVAVMGIVGLFVAQRAGHGAPYYGGLVFFVFAILFVFLVIKHAYDRSEGIRNGGMPLALRIGASAAVGYLVYGMAVESIPDKAMLAAIAVAVVLFGLLEIIDRIAVRDE